jgi:flagellar hook-length control protein FliK
VVIQATPQVEAAPVQAAQSPQDNHGADQQKSSKAEKNGLGVFAKILAGLSLGRKTGTGEQAVRAAGSGVSLSGTAESGPDSAGKTKNSLLKKVSPLTVDKNGTGKTAKAGANAELTESELSEQEKNLLLSLGGLVNRNETRVAEESLSEKGRAARLSAEEAGRAGAISKISPEGAEKTGVNLRQLQPEGTVLSAAGNSEKVAEAGQKSKINNEKAKNGRFSAEIADASTKTASQIAGEGLVRQASAKNNVSGEGKGRLEEVRNREKRRGATLEVRDFRNSGVQAEAVAKETAFQVKASAENRPFGAADREVFLELRLPQGREAAPAVTSWEANSGRAIENLLARELHQSFNNDIVRHASVILRENNEGLIRLALKPESLGNVKIQLELADNKIIGHIVVESEEALRAFEKEVSSLEKAFRDSGFDGASLQMSLASDGGEQQQWQEREANPLLPGLVASRYDAEIERSETFSAFDSYQWGMQTVNVLA